MSGSLNKVTLIGNLGADPEFKAFDNGSELANFRIATSEQWTDRTTGERKEKTEWHSIVASGDGLIKIIRTYIKKGSKVCIEGKLQTRKFEKDGVEHYRTEIRVGGFNSSLIMLDTSNKDNSGSGHANSGSNRTQNGTDNGFDTTPSGFAGFDDRDLEDVPF